MQKSLSKSQFFPLTVFSLRKPDKFLISKTEQAKWQMMISVFRRNAILLQDEAVGEVKDREEMMKLGKARKAKQGWHLEYVRLARLLEARWAWRCWQERTYCPEAMGNTSKLPRLELTIALVSCRWTEQSGSEWLYSQGWSGVHTQQHLLPIFSKAG